MLWMFWELCVVLFLLWSDHNDDMKVNTVVTVKLVKSLKKWIFNDPFEKNEAVSFKS